MTTLIIITALMVMLHFSNRKLWPLPYLNFADSYSCVQDAVDAYGDGNIIYFHPGTYKIESPISITSDHVKMIGATGNRLEFTGGCLEMHDCSYGLISGLNFFSEDSSGFGVSIDE